MNPGLCLILRICFDSFCSGRAKSRCGGVLAVIFSDFYRQHSFGFSALRTIIHQFSLTFMSSTSFGDYLILGTQHMNLSQNGRNPRPASLPVCNSTVQLLGDGPEHDIKQRPTARHKNNPLRPKGMYIWGHNQ